MSVYFEIAYAAVNNSLCLFTGTGFSKAVSDNEAPSWQGLLEQVCDDCKKPDELKKSLFPDDGNHPLSLEEAAQVISNVLRNEGENIHQKIADSIKKVDLKGDNKAVKKFFKNQSFDVVTTNYDKLAEQLCDQENYQSLTPGLPIPRSRENARVYHIHGSVDVPDKMIVTADDYFQFLNAESYFSRKLSTLLHENTVVILGYSLGDTNLKAILSDYMKFTRNHVIGSNIIFVSQSKISQHVKDYYAISYGIRVIDNIEVEDFFNGVDKKLEEAKKCLIASKAALVEVVGGTKKFSREYLKLENSFYEILASIAAAGLSVDNEGVVTAIGKIIKTKTTLTSEGGAWEQYTHLANWLIYLATVLEIENTSIRNAFLAAVKSSMSSMSKENILGYSWHAYGAWATKWRNIKPNNRVLIKKYMEKHKISDDAKYIIGLG